MMSTAGGGRVLLLPLVLVLARATTIYQNDYEPRVFDYIPSNCYDCLSYRDIILTQLTDVPARAFAHFNLGSRDTFMILNGHVKLALHPFAFQSLVVKKPNRTLTITLAAPNSWLNITENTFDGLELHSYSTLRIIIKFFYGITFHTHALSGIRMGAHSRLIIDISSVTEINFESHVIQENDVDASIDFLLARTDTVVFEPHSFAQLSIKPNQIVSFQFELISHIHFKSNAFQSLQLQAGSSFQFYSIFLSRLTIDSHAFDGMQLDANAVFNVTIRTLGTCLCFKSYSFNNLRTKSSSEPSLVLFQFHTLRGLSFFAHAFANLSLRHAQSQLKIVSSNPFNDPNPMVNFAKDAFSTLDAGSVLLNFSEVIAVRFEQSSLSTNHLAHHVHLRSISLVDLSALTAHSIRTKFQLHFDHVRYVKWHELLADERHVHAAHHRSLIQYHFKYLSSSSCLIYSAPRSVPWLVSASNLTNCNCPLLYAYKHGQLDGQSVPCLHAMSGHEAAERMEQCDFERLKANCTSALHALTNANASDDAPPATLDLDDLLIRQLYDRNYLSCSFNYSTLPASFLIRSRLLGNFGLVLGIILGIFLVLLFVVMALLNGLQYKMREYDETWTWRRNMSWTTLRRTLSQTSLRRSRRDLRTISGHGVTSKSDNQLDRLRYEQDDADEQATTYDFKQSQSIQEDLERNYRMHL